MKLMKWAVAVSCAVTLFACPGPMDELDGGTGGGSETGGGAATGGGSATGGGDATGGGGGDVDAGVDCMTITLDARLGTFTLGTGATIAQTAALPMGVTQVALVGTQLFGLSGEDVIPLGALPTLTAGAPVATVRDDAGSIFTSGYLASNGAQLLAGYTASGPGFPGAVTLYDPADGGVLRVPANGNYDAVGLASGDFFVNGLTLGDQTGAGLYTLSPSGAATGVVTFDASWSSGYVAATTEGVTLVGYADMNFANHLVAVPAARFLGVPFTLPGEVEVYDGAEYLSDVAAAGSDAVLVVGSYDATFSPAPTQVVRYPLSTDGGAVTVGAATPLLSSTDVCTSVLFVQNHGAKVLIGVQDRTGARVLDVQP